MDTVNNQMLKTPIEAFLAHCETEPNKVFLRQPINGDLIEYSYADALFEVKCMAARLKELPDKSHVGILSHNCAHWILSDLAIMLSGLISVPIYPTASASTIAQILEHANCQLLFVGKMPEWQTKNYLLPSEMHTISMHSEHQGMESWTGTTSRYSALDHYDLPNLDEMASIIYTSGTTGMPKGVMTSYRSLAEGGKVVIDWVKLSKDDRFLSYLPLAHVAERNVVEIGTVYCGGVISFVESIETFNHDLKSSSATIFLGVPRIWIKFQQAIENKISSNLLSLLLTIPVLNSYLKKKLIAELGLSEVRLAIAGAAAMPKDTLDWFDKLGMPICEAYGMTESFGNATFNHPDLRRSGSVGSALPGCELKIADDGEVLYKNNCLMMGYYREPELTKQSMSEGFLHTGDTGSIDADGYLWITGRVKDLFKTSKGKYVSPVKIEMELEPRANLEQLCVMGSGLAQPVVVGTVLTKPDKSELIAFEKKLEGVMNEVNQRLEKSERIKKWFLIDEQWNSDNELITPTLKLRRHAIEQRYMPQVQALMDDKKTILWLKKKT